MLYLTRKIGESVVINDDIEVTVVDIRGKSIKLGFTFPPEASVLRREIYERIQEENRAAAGGSDALADVLGGSRTLAAKPSTDQAAVEKTTLNKKSADEAPAEKAPQSSRQD
ncbi:carbon storage regulator CsrA [Algihabitans albus]|uniref:carbon storage regulator CsrA n=1 Tax=Algihabitans albus TaxID=2164067 RepID=UPI000E5D3AE2|nr:carbon storage regulator CsrA [Algihabitans albus]